MFSHKHYVPVLKWRQSEYQAITKLDEETKNMLTPLFEIPKETWDFEKKQAAKSVDEHLSTFGKRLKAKWGVRRCFVDSCHLNGDVCMEDGEHHLSYIFGLVRKEGANAIPVVGLGQASSYIATAKQIIALDKKGACLRLQDDDFDEKLHEKIGSLLKKLGLRTEDCDLVIDLGNAIVASKKNQAIVWFDLLNQIPNSNIWRSLTICSTAFPAALPSSIFRPSGEAVRYDWLSFKALLKKLPRGQRVPTFGDYGTAATNTEMMDPRMMDPTAKIKYTIEDRWFIALGTQVKKNGRGQYVDLCKRIIEHNPNIFEGRDYSWGDQYIEDCSLEKEGTGGSSTWPSVAINHHVTKVTEDVANLFAL